MMAIYKQQIISQTFVCSFEKVHKGINSKFLKDTWLIDIIIEIKL